MIDFVYSVFFFLSPCAVKQFHNKLTNGNDDTGQQAIEGKKKKMKSETRRTRGEVKARVERRKIR